MLRLYRLPTPPKNCNLQFENLVITFRRARERNFASARRCRRLALRNVALCPTYSFGLFWCIWPTPADGRPRASAHIFKMTPPVKVKQCCDICAHILMTAAPVSSSVARCARTSSRLRLAFCSCVARAQTHLHDDRNCVRVLAYGVRACQSETAL